MKKQMLVIAALLCIAVVLSACCNPLAITQRGRTDPPDSPERVVHPAGQDPEPCPTCKPCPDDEPCPECKPCPETGNEPCPTCEPTSGGGISLGPSAAEGIEGRDDKAGFHAELAGALEERGWTIINQDSEYISVEDPDTTLKIILVYGYESPALSRVVVQVIFGGLGPDVNLSCEAFEAYNSVNDGYNVGKVSADFEGDIWFETVYTFTDALEPDAFVEYLQWVGDSLFIMLEEIEDYTS